MMTNSNVPSKRPALMADAAMRSVAMRFGGSAPFFAVFGGRTTVYLHFLRVTMAARTYQLIGLAPEQHRQTLREAADLKSI